MEQPFIPDDPGIDPDYDAIEFEPRLAYGLRGRWPNVDVVCGDALAAVFPD